MDRRTFLRLTSITAASTMFPFRAMSQAMSGTTSGYKALVCVFLYGGNDSNNMLIPMDATSYKLYAAARKSLALSQSSLLPLAGVGYGIHPLMPMTQALFSSKNLAFVANMGALVRPTTRAQILNNTAVLPDNLMSHPDQRNCMQSALQTSGWAPGWGGRIADTMSSAQSASIPMGISLYGSNCFIDGKRSGGFLPPESDCSGSPICTAASNIAQITSNLALVQADEQIVSTLATEGSAYLDAIKNASLPSVPFPTTGPASQLETVAKIISVRDQLQATRQIFFVGMQGFDTHVSQLDTQASKLAALDGAIGAFASALQAMNLFNDVTLFTLSDFTRTLNMNNCAGSDHGWGGHHIVMGGSVQGGRIYGEFPTLEPGGPDDMTGLGSWIPSTSLNQFAATLASWFGVSHGDLTGILPDLANFPVQNIGFV